MRRILFLTILATFYSDSTLSRKSTPCSVENILGQSFTKKRVSEEVVSTQHWSVMPNELSPNSGTYQKLKFLKAFAGDEIQLIYNDKLGVKKLSAILDEESIANINFTQWFDKVYTFRGGTLLIKIIRNKKTKVCEFKMEIEGEN